MTEDPGIGGVLTVVGLNSDSERLYRAVLRRPGLTLDSLADTSGRSVDDTLLDLEPLVERNLVRRTDNTVQAEPPEIALGRLLTSAARRLSAAESALGLAQDHMNSFVAEHRAGQGSGWRPVTIEVIPPADVGDVMQALIETSSGELRFMRPDQWHLPTGLRTDSAVSAALRAGRRSRVLYPSTVLDADSESLRRRAALGESIRMLPSLPSRLAVLGAESALVPETWGTTSDPILIRQPAIVEVLAAYFDQLWERAMPIPGYTGSMSGNTRQELVTLLGQGAKDEQIARTMELSLRTVRRRIADVMAELGVDSRFQAGMEAVRRGWL